MDIVGIIIGLAGIAIAIFTHASSSDQLSGLKNEKSILEGLKREAEEAKRKAEGKLPKVVRHTVLLDGITRSGKTSFAMRLVNPTVTRQDLEHLTATRKEHLTKELPLCWARSSRLTILNTIRFYDVAGEHPRTTVDALIDLTQLEAEKREKQNVVLVIIWDLDASVDSNKSHLNSHRLDAVYGNRYAKHLIQGIVVFFNKIDKIDIAARKSKIAECRVHLEKIFKEQFEAGYGDTEFCSGSVLVGMGLHDCYAEILKKLGLSQEFDEETSEDNAA